MAKVRKAWELLSEAYRKRLIKAGITKAKYVAGESLQAARGHANTPEHPEDAYKGKYAEKFAQYRYRRAERLRKKNTDKTGMKPSAAQRARAYMELEEWRRKKPYWPGDETTEFWKEYQKLGGVGKVA